MSRNIDLAALKQTLDFAVTKFKELSVNVLRFRNELNSAKTSIKREYFQSKLEKEKQRALATLIHIDKLTALIQQQEPNFKQALKNSSVEESEIPQRHGLV